MDKLLAKPNVSFLTHTKATINVARYFVEKHNINKYDSFENFLDDITKIAAFHDIGKCTSTFQSKLNCANSNDDVDIDDSSKKDYRHNEVSAAIYAGLFGSDKNRNVIRTILNHHPHTLSLKSEVCEILDNNKVSGKDTNLIINKVVPQLTEVLKKDYNITVCPNDFDEGVIVDPSYIVINKESKRGSGDISSISTRLMNSYQFFLYAVIFYADRLVSENRFISVIDDIANNNLDSIKPVIDNRCLSRDWGEMESYVHSLISKMDNVDFNRLENQKSIARNTATTLSVCLPTGNGKTLPSLLSAINGKRRGIIVSPEISVTLSNKGEVDKLVRKMGITDANIGYMKGNQYIEGDANSDFVCINIDSFLNYIYKNNNAKYMLSLLFDPIIFDEWHILCENDNAIMTLFTNILWIRHNLTKAHTLLLSATPINSFFDGINTNSTFNKEKVMHFTAPSYKRDNKYRIVTKVINDLKDICPIIDSMDSTLVRVNSHKQANIIQRNLKNDAILYSNRLTDCDIEEVVKKILTDFDKKYHDNNKPNIITTTKGEKSLNFSCRNCVEIIKSPIDTIQTLGRVPRCKTDSITNYYAVFYDNERTNSNLQYPVHLMKKWFDMLKRYNGKIICEQDLYDLYNEFENVYRKDVTTYVGENYINGIDIVKKLALSRLYKHENDCERHLANKVTLRGDNRQVFVTAINTDTNEWCQPIAIDKTVLSREIDIDGNRKARCIELKKIFETEGKNKREITKLINKIKNNWETECEFATNEKYAIHLPNASYSRKYGLEIQ